MEVSLDQAVEMHARALTRRLNGDAPTDARERADGLRQAGDSEGHGVWLRVAESAERLLNERMRDASSPSPR